MKAAVSVRYGPPDVVRITDVPTPAPGDDELLVKVHATTVNRTDCSYRAPHPAFARLFFGLVKPKLTILGSEFAGEVVALGRRVTSFAVGDRVFGYIEGASGAHAEFLTIPEDGSVATIPPDMTYEEAAPATEGSHYALMFLRSAQITSGDDVLLYGATGAIGSAGVQLLKYVGATVTAVCATDHMSLVRSLGADTVIDYTAGDFATHGQTYDVVLDAVGKITFRQCAPLLRPGGTYISSDLGPLAQNPLLALVTPLLPGKTVRFPIPTHDQQMIRFFRALMESRAFRPVIDRRYPLRQIVEAYRYVESGQKVGNVVITVAPPSGPPHAAH